MIRILLVLSCLSLLNCKSKDLVSKKDLSKMSIPFEKDKNQSASYDQIISFYQDVAQESKFVKISPFGLTDSGEPLHEVVIANKNAFTPEEVLKQKKVALFINNGIHPGESCGIDASMLLVKKLVSEPKYNELLDYATIVVLPIYNVGGCLNRGSFSRANQNGPSHYGFRGNAKNLDLNRDFIKVDSKNAVSFNQLFTKWSPHILIDNHTSNGADYQYTMTLVASQKDKLNPVLHKIMTKSLLPFMYEKMERDGYEMIPYVYSRGTPDHGIIGFLDHPRYSSGYGTLHHCLSFMPETHMLKPYQDRVKSTLRFSINMLEYIKGNKNFILDSKTEAENNCINQKEFPLNWTMNFAQVDSLKFKGYEAKYKPSSVTGHSRLYYDRNAPYEKSIAYYNNYFSTTNIEKPKAYIIPQAYSNIISNMINNGVQVSKLDKDTSLVVEQYYIEDYETVKSPYEGHYLHSKVKCKKVKRSWSFSKGDFIIYTNQKQNRYIIETLEPQAPDSWFAWNYFDGILMQKEYFSDYVFEDTAFELLEENHELKAIFMEKKENDIEFASNPQEQLRFIYRNSPYYEQTHNLYPIGRLMN